VAEGRVVDWLLEQDAASKSKVDDMRDLLERVPLGTSGNRKVIILDEVHMLSQGAENALLKTLEEPPAHVVFILATTDPQKVRPTILSRTQHFEFHLLPPDLLGDHVRRIIADAGLGIDAASVDAAVDHVLRAGQGSARDTLSALDQVAALGEVLDEAQPVDAVLDAVCDRDAGRVLLAVADALAAGRDPRTLGEALIGALRDAFLSLMGAADEHLAPGQRERAARVGAALGAAGLTRALDVLGEALTELSRKPDPRIVVEVALIRITQPAADRTLDAVLERLDRLERGAPPATPAAGTAAAPVGAEHGAAAAREVLSSSRRREPEPPAAAKGSATTLGAVSRRRGGRSTTPPDPEAAMPAPPEADRSPPAPVVAEPPGSAAAPQAEAALPATRELDAAWSGSVLAGLPVKFRSKWRGGRWIEPGDGRVRFAVPNTWHQKECEKSRRDVEQALAAHFGRPVAVAVVVEGGVPAGPPPGAPPPPEPDDEHIDPAELRDAADADVATNGVDLLLREFGGGQLVEEEK
jgi:DNA polymerase-3 subunit gamma/tau